MQQEVIELGVPLAGPVGSQKGIAMVLGRFVRVAAPQMEIEQGETFAGFVESAGTESWNSKNSVFRQPAFCRSR